MNDKHSSKVETKSKPTREYVKDFVDANTRIAVRIQRTNNFRPYYSILIGRFIETQDGEVWTPYVPVRVQAKNAKVESSDNHGPIIANLVKDATEWILEICQTRENEILEQKIERETKDLNRVKDGKRPGLKELSKIDRATKNYT